MRVKPFNVLADQRRSRWCGQEEVGIEINGNSFSSPKS